MRSFLLNFEKAIEMIIADSKTPHWRPGPPEKPVLCNACGTRWRVMGTLHNYIPRHANRETQNMQMEETNDKDPIWNPNSVPKRKRSELAQHILSRVERLRRQLYNILQEPEFGNIPDGGEDATIIYARNKYVPPNEIGLGGMLLVSPTTTTERCTSLSPMAEDNACCSMNVPVENPNL
ncbi:uncharacterized protein [Solanum lycopersicum]|uniref:uncharacterized protein n=1 Tax=Solanum lycopersicum TaxID=4081 RepID=UPI0002BC99DC